MFKHSTLIRTLCVAALAVASSGCATMYVSDALKDVQPSEYQRPAAPQPVQLVFAFKTKGATNGRATALLKQQVSDIVGGSGLFSAVSAEPVPNGALLSIALDNTGGSSTGEAVGKGVATGLTLGLAGSQVVDGYVCTVDYQATGNAEHLVHETHHGILTNVGAHTAPANATKAASPDEAVHTMTRQIVGNALKELSADPKFPK